jgi:photosystem II stability/assembly factor-like uncharacterized protein
MASRDCICSLANLLLSILSCASMQAQTNVWQSSNGPYGGTVNCLAVNPNGYMFAATQGNGVFYSTNGGSRWLRSVDDSASIWPHVLAVGNKDNVYVGGEDGVNRWSTDNGVSWRSMSLPGGLVLALAVGSTDTVYAGTNSSGVYRSTDGGISWTQLSTGLGAIGVYSLAIAPNGFVFAGTEAGLFRSTSHGEAWAQVVGVPGVLALAANSVSQVFAGTVDGRLLKSTNNGTNWQQVDSSLIGLQVNSIVTWGANTVFVGTSNGIILRSTDKGENWSHVESGLDGERVNALTLDSHGRLFTGTAGSGVMQSTDGGNSWNVANAGLVNTYVQAVAFNSSGHCFVGAGGQVFRSSDRGDSWRRVDSGMSGENVLSLAVDRDDRVFVGTSGAGIFRSLDGETTWAPVNIGLGPKAVRSLVVNVNGDVYAGTIQGGVFRSTDHGDTWNQCINGPLVVKSLGVGLTGHIFAGTAGNGIFRSTDDGSTWETVNGGIPSSPFWGRDIWAIGCDPDGALYAGMTYNGVVKSTNDGQSWVQSNSGLTQPDVTSIAINATGDVFLAALIVFRTTDGGANWVAFDGASADLRVASLGVDPDGFLFVGTKGQGAFRSAMSTTFQRSIRLTSPNGGEKWQVGSADDIRWITSGIDRVRLEYTTDSGTNWITIVGSTVASIGRYTWTIPNTPSTQCRVRISDVLNPNVSDSSNSSFSIAQGSTGAWTEVWDSHQDAIISLAVVGSTLLGGTTGQLGTYQDIYSSDDWGSTWKPTNLNRRTYSMVSRGNEVFAAAGDGMYVSQSRNAGWTQVMKSPGISHFISAIICGDTVLAGTEYDGAFRSLDGGTSWVQINSGLSNEYVTSFAVVDSYLFAGTSGGVFRSTNWGTSWNKMSEGLGVWSKEVSALASCEGALVAGTSSEGVYRSADYAKTWTHIVAGLTSSANSAWELKAFNNIVFLGSWSGGVFLSTDGGLNWNAINEGLSPLYIDGLAISGSHIFASVPGGHLFRRPLSELVNSRVLVLGSPIDGESWSVGSTQTIKWTSTNVKNVKLEYSIDNGASWVLPPIIASTPAASGSYSWAVPNTPSAQCRVRISDVSNALTVDTSEGVFSIGHTPVIILPGIMGSPLYNDANHDQNLTDFERDWVDDCLNIASVASLLYDPGLLPTFIAEFERRMLELKLDEYGTNPPSGTNLFIASSPLRDYSNQLKREPLAHYEGLVQTLRGRLGYTLHESDGTYVSPEDLFIFSYDWRKSVLLAGNELSLFIDQVKRWTGANRVTIIAHSMGGLVTKACIRSGQTAIDRIIFVGTPHWGAPDAIYKSLTGEAFDKWYERVFFWPQIMKVLTKNFRSVYGLFPNRQLCDLLPSKVLIQAEIGTACKLLGYPDAMDYLRALKLSPSGTTDLNAALLDKGIQDLSDVALQDYGTTKVAIVVGDGLPTVNMVRVDESGVIGLAQFNGDGTVPLASALASGAPKPDAVRIVTVEHSNLCNNGTVCDAIVQILQNATAKMAPSHMNVVGNSSSDAYQVTARGGAVLHAYDWFGRHTGPTSDSTYETNIPGSYYLGNAIASLSDTKAILLPHLSGYRIVLQPLDSAVTPELDIDDLQGGGDAAFVNYHAVPLASTARASLSLDSVHAGLTLNVDQKGDGSSIIPVKPRRFVIAALPEEGAAKSKLPLAFRLAQNYPNPFNPSTTIGYGLPNRSHVTLTVFNTLGQQVATLQNGEQDAGYHEVKFDATNLSSGVYFYRMQAGSYVETKKLLLMR